MMKGGDKGKEADMDSVQINSIPPLIPIESRGLLPLPCEHKGGEATHIEVQGCGRMWVF